MSSFSSADVKGLLEAFSTTLKRHLLTGDTVELEGIGLFSISISSLKEVERPSQINATKSLFKFSSIIIL